jgi:hypothetical protein
MATDLMDRIKHHMKLADESEATASENNWAAARYVWEAVKAGIVQKDIAEETGKSQAHITRLKKCWEIRVVNQGVRRPVYRDLGNFYQFYNSPEVRGESGREPGSGERERRGETERGDYTTSGLVFRASSAIDALYRNPAHMETISDDDIDKLEEIRRRIAGILRKLRLRSV